MIQIQILHVILVVVSWYIQNQLKYKLDILEINVYLDKNDNLFQKLHLHYYMVRNYISLFLEN